MPKKKKFIDRKNAVTFHLVHRSQQDPLAADENAPQRVLLPETPKPDKNIEERHKYGIYFDDDYNYLQHLRETGPMEWEQVEYKQKTNAKLNLPSSVFASNVEEDVGLLNKAAPQSGLRLDLDPDIVAAMDDDFDYSNPENELEDNFIELANIEGSDEDDEYDDDSDNENSSNFGSEERDEVCSLEGPQFSFKDEETKSRFTEYSMSSSIIRRNEQLSLLDSRFEKMYAAYDDNEIGALDCEEIEGYVPENSDILLQYAEQFEKDQARKKLDDIKEKMCLQEYSESEGDDELVDMEVPKKEKWDCESILSTYSNIYNHPKLIEEAGKSKIQINMRTGMPMNIFNSNRLTAKALESLNQQNDPKNKESTPTYAESVISTLSTLSIRPKDESSTERKERKKLLREYRRERRTEKKANTQAFKEEAKRQAKIVMNNRNNIQGNKIL